jgi:hypothetical protein
MLVNPKQLFKVLKAAGIRVRFDVEQKALVIITDQGEQVHPFAEIEKMVNGE